MIDRGEQSTCAGSSVVEFLPALDKLAHPERFGGAVGDGFDVVVPSLPGFGFSGKPRAPLGPKETARIWPRLMTGVRGYGRFFAQDGDRWDLEFHEVKHRQLQALIGRIAGHHDLV